MVIAIAACTNPFAPALKVGDTQSAILGDQTTLDGVFQNFRYAYMFKDTLVYGDLLHDDFIFIFKNYEKNGIDESWSREEEMRITYRMFQATQNVDLIWSETVIQIGDSLTKDISRGFTLNIFFSPTDYVNIDGRVNLRVKREEADDPWKIIRWRDESNF